MDCVIIKCHVSHKQDMFAQHAPKTCQTPSKSQIKKIIIMD